MTFNLTKKRLGDCIDVTDFVANGSFASLKANVQYLDDSSSDKFAVLVRTLDFNRNWNGEYVWVDEAAYHFLKKSSLIQGDLVLCNVGSVGIVFEVPDLGLPMTLGPNSVLCRTKDVNVIRQRFVYYYFLSSTGQALLEELSGGSTVQPKFNKTVLRNSEIDIPDLVHQDFIVQILGILDSKISANAAISKTLESMAQAIFKSWYIDFDPVKAKMAGEKPAGMDAATAALFPDSMEESELGLVPNGWPVKLLGDLVVPRKGKTITRATCVVGEVPVVAGGLQPAYFHNTANVKQPAITVSASGANAGYVRLYLKDIWASDCSYINSEITQTVHFWYLFLSRNQELIYGMQQGAAQPHIYPSDLIRLKLSYPNSIDSVMKFEEVVGPLFLEIGALEQQNDSLRSLRESLLPRLISGELQIPEETLAS